MPVHRYLIIGSGAAGVGAVEGIRSLDANGEIILLCEEKEGYYSRPGLAYYLANELPEKMLFPFTEDDFQRLNVRREFGRAVGLRLPERQVQLQDGRRIPYDQLLLATGAGQLPSSAPPGCPTESGISVQHSLQGDFNFGAGPSVGGSVQYDGNGGGSLQTGIGKVGVGYGLQVSGGVTQTVTIATPPLFPSD